MITPAQTTTLKTAITGDVALTALVVSGNDQKIADYYAVPTDTMIQVSVLTKGDFLLGVMAGIAALNGAPTLQNKWDRFLRVVASVDVVRVSQPAVQSLLGQMVTDGLMTQPQVDTFIKRPATRAEVLLGVDVVVQHTDVATAMRGTF